MSYLEPENTTLGDICRASLKECGAIGVGQTPLAEDINDAWARCQWMLMQWERKRWLIWNLVTLSTMSTGQLSYTVGPGGQFDTGPISMRPTRLASCFVRQQGISQGSFWDTLVFGGPSLWDGQESLWDQSGTQNSIDYSMEIMESKEDYNRITIKALQAGPGEAAYLETSWPLSQLFVWPVPQPNIYQVWASFYVPIQIQFATPSTVFTIPWEHYNAIMLNLAIRLRPKYRLGTYPGDPLPGMARDSLAVLRSSQAQIARLRMPMGIRRRGLYNIFSDRPY